MRGERVVDAPDRAQQAHERRGGPHGGQQHLAVLQLPSTPCRASRSTRVSLLRQRPGGSQRGPQRPQRAEPPLARPPPAVHQRLAVKRLRGQRCTARPARATCQKRPCAARHIAPARSSSRAFQSITTQLATDMASSSRRHQPGSRHRPGATSEGRPWRAGLRSVQRLSTSNMSNMPVLRAARKRTARRLPWA
jgi:hypothetical protein